MRIVEKHRHILYLCTSGLCILIACNEVTKEKPDRQADTELIEKTIHSSIGWAKNKDFQLLHSVLANDQDYLEVHPDGRVVNGFNEFKKAEATWSSPDFKALSYEIRDLSIHLSNSGNVAWWFCILDDITEWKGEVVGWMNTRWTGVLEKRKGRWVIVQMHFSFGKTQ